MGTINVKVSIVLLSILIVGCVSNYSLLKPIDSKYCELSTYRIEFSFTKSYEYIYKKHLKDTGYTKIEQFARSDVVLNGIGKIVKL